MDPFCIFPKKALDEMDVVEAREVKQRGRRISFAINFEITRHGNFIRLYTCM